jgi:hypothetical protein
MKSLKLHKGIFMGILIFLLIVLLDQAWYSYQKHAAIHYLSKATSLDGDSCYSGNAVVTTLPSCYKAGATTFQRYLLGIGVVYSIPQVGNLSCSDAIHGNIVSFPGKNFVFSQGIEQSNTCA